MSGCPTHMPISFQHLPALSKVVSRALVCSHPRLTAPNDPHQWVLSSDIQDPVILLSAATNYFGFIMHFEPKSPFSCRLWSRPCLFKDQFHKVRWKAVAVVHTHPTPFSGMRGFRLHLGRPLPKKNHQGPSFTTSEVITQYLSLQEHIKNPCRKTSEKGLVTLLPRQCHDVLPLEQAM
jgi:hypothetical protein